MFRSKKYRFSLIFTKVNAKYIILKPFTDLCKYPFNFYSILKNKASAYRNRFDLTARGMSFTYMRNSKGPSMDPCVTPYVILERSE